jgi:hypothetical protein
MAQHLLLTSPFFYLRPAIPFLPIGPSAVSISTQPRIACTPGHCGVGPACHPLIKSARAAPWDCQWDPMTRPVFSAGRSERTARIARSLDRPPPTIGLSPWNKTPMAPASPPALLQSLGAMPLPSDPRVLAKMAGSRHHGRAQ